jgi:hypothetical protein
MWSASRSPGLDELGLEDPRELGLAEDAAVTMPGARRSSAVKKVSACRQVAASPLVTTACPAGRRALPLGERVDRAAVGRAAFCAASS